MMTLGGPKPLKYVYIVLSVCAVLTWRIIAFITFIYKIINSGN